MKRLLTFFLAITMLAFLFGSANATTIIYNDFSDVSALTRNGSTASITNPANYNGHYVLRLTNNYWQGGSAFLTNPVPINNDYSFSTYFSFQITQSGGAEGGADGLTFIVQTNNANVGGSGGSIGYGGIQNSVAIEYDTYNNGLCDGFNGNHVGIDLNGNISSVARSNVSSDLLNNGEIWYTWIDYNGSTDLLEVRLSQTQTRPTTAILNYTVDLAGVLGTPTAYVGFSSGTGAGMGVHDIREWTFVDDYHPVNPVPEPATLFLLGSALVGLAGFRKNS